MEAIDMLKRTMLSAERAVCCIATPTTIWMTPATTVTIFERIGLISSHVNPLERGSLTPTGDRSVGPESGFRTGRYDRL